MQTPPDNSIRKFIPPAQLREERVSYSESYQGSTYPVPPEQTSIAEVINSTQVQTRPHERSKAAQHTAYLQSKINALRKSPPPTQINIQPENSSNAAAQTAVLQQRINQVRNK